MSLRDDMDALQEALYWGKHHAIFHMHGEERAAEMLTTAQFIEAYDHWNAKFVGIYRQRAIYPQPRKEIF